MSLKNKISVVAAKYLWLKYLWLDIRSIRVRLTLLFVMLLAMTLVGFSWFLYQTFVETHKQEYDNALFNYAIDLTDSIDINRVGRVSIDHEDLKEREKILPFSLGSALVQICERSGKVLFQSKSFGKVKFPFDEDYAAISNGQEAVFRTLYDIGQDLPESYSDSYRLITYPIDSAIPPKYVLQVAAPRTILEAQQLEIIRSFYIVIPLVLLLAMAGGLFLAGRALDPVKNIVDQANSFGAIHLKQRLVVPKIQDEVRVLVETLNGMLDRIEQSFQSQERFIADASHQLLTPLSIMRGELDVMSKQADENELRKFVFSMGQEIDHLSQIVKDMLLLARVDAGVEFMSFEPVEMESVLFDVISKLKSKIEAKQIKIQLNLLDENAIALVVHGERDLLANLLKNVIENAIKYSPQQSVVRIELQQKDDKKNDDKKSLECRIFDSGIGIPGHRASDIFHRFYRVPESSTAAPGYGLGLAIAKKIAHIHSGDLYFVSEPGKGTEFRLELPLASRRAND